MVFREYKEKSFHQRVVFYLGDLLKSKNMDKNISEKFEYNGNECDWYSKNEAKFRDHALHFLDSLFKDRGRFFFNLHDNNSHSNSHVLVKNRHGLDNSGVIVFSYKLSRHWGGYYNSIDKLPFEKKINKVIWRGTTTGDPNKKANRYTLVTKYFYNKNVNIGFSKVAQHKQKYNSYLKGNISMPVMRTYKYIISVEGNDKDSGINWKLASNSVVLMARPRYVSWLMESELIPNYHYVLLKDDFSDLIEKVEWCNNNQDKCKEIIKNAHKFMDQFKDLNEQKKIENEVLRIYFNRLKELGIN